MLERIDQFMSSSDRLDVVLRVHALRADVEAEAVEFVCPASSIARASGSTSSTAQPNLYCRLTTAVDSVLHAVADHHFELPGVIPCELFDLFGIIHHEDFDAFATA
jgi:hypothetical protein